MQSQSHCRNRLPQQRVAGIIANRIGKVDANADLQSQMVQARLDSESGATDRNLKRFQGGTMDVEYIVQFLQLLTATIQRFKGQNGSGTGKFA